MELSAEESALNQLTHRVIGAAIEVHRELGPALLEGVYEQALCYELGANGLEVRSQVKVPVVYRGRTLDYALRADLVINDLLVVELKSIEAVTSVHKKQLLTYLRLMDLPLGLLINFGRTVLKDGIHRVANIKN